MKMPQCPSQLKIALPVFWFMSVPGQVPCHLQRLATCRNCVVNTLSRGSLPHSSAHCPCETIRVKPWSTMFRPWLTMVFGHGQPWYDHGLTMVDHGQPCVKWHHGQTWLTVDHGWLWNMVGCGPWLTVEHGQPHFQGDHGRPWSAAELADHGRPWFDHGWPWSTMFWTSIR